MKDIINEAEGIIKNMNGVTDEKIEKIRTSVEKTTSSLNGVRVMGGRKLNSYEDSLLTLAEMTSIRDNAYNELRELYKRIPSENRDLRIYFEKKYLLIGYTAQEKNVILETKYGIGKNRINKICKKIEKNYISTH